MEIDTTCFPTILFFCLLDVCSPCSLSVDPDCSCLSHFFFAKTPCLFCWCLNPHLLRVWDINWDRSPQKSPSLRGKNASSMEPFRTWRSWFLTCTRPMAQWLCYLNDNHHLSGIAPLSTSFKHKTKGEIWGHDWIIEKRGLMRLNGWFIDVYSLWKWGVLNLPALLGTPTSGRMTDHKQRPPEGTMWVSPMPQNVYNYLDDTHIYARIWLEFSCACRHMHQFLRHDICWRFQLRAGVKLSTAEFLSAVQMIFFLKMWLAHHRAGRAGLQTLRK